MSEHDFRARLWSLIILAVKLLGQFWGFADDIKVIRSNHVPIQADIESESVVLTGVIRYK